MGVFNSILRENQFKPEEVPAFEKKLFFEGSRRRPYLERFAVLLFLATVIATAGVIGDSTATVIGAMIIAPLMLPIMATAAALVMGQQARAASSALLVAVGVAGVIFVSWLIALLYPDVIAFNANTQITARTSPRLLDLLAALASGAAGAFCMSRDDIADSLPGVAIAISLVPPLCVVGVSLAYGEQFYAWRAMLLFITNVLSILLAGGAVLAALNLSRAAMVQLTGSARRNAFALIGLSVMVVAVPLWITGTQITRDTRNKLLLREISELWVTGTEFEVVLTDVAGDQSSVIITGPGEPPSTDSLFAGIDRVIGPQMSVEVELLPAQRLVRAGLAPPLP